MERLQFKSTIHASVKEVYDMMLGVDTFKQWTSAFNPTSDFIGSWEKGSKIKFVGTNEQGKTEGMLALIEENVPEKFVSIKYVGLVDGDNEITEGEAISDWVGGYENYTFEESEGKTFLKVDIDVNSQMLDYFKTTYPKALEHLKTICEA